MWWYCFFFFIFFFNNPLKIHNKDILVSWVLAVLPQVGECLFMCGVLPCPVSRQSKGLVLYKFGSILS